MWPLILAGLISSGMQYGAGQRSARREKKAAQKSRASALRELAFFDKRTAPEARVAQAEASLGGAGGLFDERKERLNEELEISRGRIASGVDSANTRAKMLREQLQAQQWGSAANALGGMAALYQPVPKANGFYSGVQQFDDGPGFWFQHEQSSPANRRMW